MNDKEDLQAEIERLKAELAAMKAAQAEASDGSAVSQGAGAKSVAAGGILIEGSVYLGPKTADPAEALRIYRQVLVQTTSSLPLRGVDIGASDPTSGQKTVGLANIYVDLDTTTRVAVQQDAPQREQPDARSAQEAETRPLSALEAAIANRHLVLLGDPGSGKSTFVNYLAHCLAAHALSPQGKWLEHLGNWPPAEADLLPIPVILRDFARSLPEPLPERANPGHLWDFITARLADQNLEFAAEPIRQMLEDGHALLLLDGLDEVPTREQRRFVRDAVRVFLKRYPGNRALITCRILSYQPPQNPEQPDLRLPELPDFTLAPFDPPKIERFIEAWYQELARLGTVEKKDVSTLTRHLQNAVRRPDLWRLAPNPLLLTVMALVHTHKGRLPDARALLYEETIDILLWRWEQIKRENAPDAPRLRQLLLEAGRTDVDLKRVLWELAFQAHQQIIPGEDDESLADIGELRLEKALAALKGGDRNWAQQVVTAMKLRAGLLLERAPEVFTFPHRTFQEYLAGAHLASRPKFAVTASNLVATGPLWDEVVLLAAGKLVYLSGEIDKPLALVGELCPVRQQDDETAWRKAWMAGRVLEEIGVARAQDSDLGRDLFARVQSRLAALLEHGALSPTERAAAGNTLAVLGDPRPEVTTIEGMSFCLISPSPFRMGGDRYDDEKPVHTNQHLDAPYWISRYPVTVAQWRVYAEASGISFNRWEDNRHPNHPVVSVTWHEAREFCQWLNQAYARALPENYHFDLPSEAEWEKAARGGLKIMEKATIAALHDGLALPDEYILVDNPAPQREYPWGNEITPDYANYRDTGLGTTSAVGAFPKSASPYGVLALSGNVWEWTRSLWGTDFGKPDFKYPYDPADGRENLEASRNTLRVLRGGAFSSSQNLVRAAARLGDRPNNRYGRNGFRVVLSPTAGCYPAATMHSETLVSETLNRGVWGACPPAFPAEGGSS